MKELTNNKLSWGVTLIFFGVLFFVKEVNILPYSLADVLFDPRNYPIYAGIIFLATRNYKFSALLFGLAIILRLDQIIDLSRNMSHYIWPLLLLVAGVILVLTKKGK